ncbi:MAG: hypothetical protein QOJ92_95 [Frankiales bacterium]|nr:hypothetical protein [Frankiales bacterium]
MGKIRNTTRRMLTATVAVVLATVGTLVVAQGAQASDPPAPTSTSARHTPRGTGATALLLDIRHAKHATFDRLVIDLRGAKPGYDVRYVSAVTYDPSGRRVTMPGRYYLQVVLDPASAYNANGNHTYGGQNRVTTSYPTLKGFVINGDFEAVLSVALGLSKKAGFRVSTLANPTRIVIDVAH